ncbi:MAG TPA: beta-phosphoglucomutase [Thermotogota bacterium]|nr:beta-phosphoglucomutase [Thermotogota bacterium]HPJ87544.1 beta-phosphoglucomutase [Thermotogota bacterium]HPR94749.1 beta-phosphoglucomutase [Thermotogota bacterium]
MIKGIIFDLDGVITDTAEYHYLGWKKMAEEEGLIFNRELNEKLRGVSRTRSLEIILEYNGKELSEKKRMELCLRKNLYYVQSLDKINEGDFLPGIRDLIVSLKGRNIKTAIASASKNAKRVIDNLNANNLFDFIADGFSVETTKPAPDLFLYTAEKIDCLPSECVVFEDAEAGIEAAINGGFKSVGIGPDERIGRATIRYKHTSTIDIERVLTL